MTDQTQLPEKQNESTLSVFYGDVVDWKQPAKEGETAPAVLTIGQKIANIKLFCDALVINGVADKKGLGVAKAVLSKLVSFRTGIEKKRLALKKEVDAEAKNIHALLTPLEAETRAKITVIENAAAEAERIRREGVHNNMITAGYRLEHGVYVVGKLIIPQQTAFDATPEQMTKLAEQGLAAKSAEEAEQAELKRLRELAAQQVATPKPADLTPGDQVFDFTVSPALHFELPPPDQQIVDPFVSAPIKTAPVLHHGDTSIAALRFEKGAKTDPTLTYDAGFKNGFEFAKKVIAEHMESDAKLTRLNWIEYVKNLKP